MIKYATLEGVSNEVLFEAFMQAFTGFRITTETTYDSFCEMLAERNYDPSISLGAYELETGRLVSFVLNSILVEDPLTVYDILTGTIPEYRRQGILKNIFGMIKKMLQQNMVQLYTTEVLKTNPNALRLYLSVGFEIADEVVNIIKTPKGSREVCEYKIVMNI